MISFFSTLLAALIASLLAPSFLQFLNIEKNKREKTLTYLEEAYLLTKKYQAHCTQLPSHITFMIGFIEHGMDMNKLPQSITSPFDRLSTILDYHLDFPADTLNRLSLLNMEVMMSFRPFAETFNHPEKKSQLYSDSLKNSMDAASKAKTITDEVTSWIKLEKTKIESKPTLFQFKYWKILGYAIFDKVKDTALYKTKSSNN